MSGANETMVMIFLKVTRSCVIESVKEYVQKLCDISRDADDGAWEEEEKIAPPSTNPGSSSQKT